MNFSVMKAKCTVDEQILRNKVVSDCDSFFRNPFLQYVFHLFGWTNEKPLHTR